MKHFIIMFAIIGAMAIMALGASVNISYFSNITPKHSTYAATSMSATTCPGHTNWTALTAGGDFSGENYVINSNVTLATSINIASGTVSICLNGYKLTGGNSTSFISIKSGATLNLYDCQGITATNSTARTHKYKIDSNGRYVFGEGEDFTETLTGGVITDGTDRRGVYNNGTFNMFGGNISGNTVTSSGGGVYNNNVIFTMSGGSIAGNTSKSSGGGVYCGGKTTFTMSGTAKILGNTAEYGGGVYNRP